MDTIPCGVADLRKSFFPVGGHRCNSNYRFHQDKMEIIQILTDLWTEVGSDEIQNIEENLKTGDAAIPENISPMRMTEDCDFLLKMMDIFDGLDISKMSPDELAATLHGSTDDSSLLPPPPKKELPKTQTDAREAAAARFSVPTSSFSAPAVEARPERAHTQLPSPSPVRVNKKCLPGRGVRGRIILHPPNPRRRGTPSPLRPLIEIETAPPHKNWNGPGMRMLPESYGEALHRHRKFAPVNENWTKDDSSSSEVARKKVGCVPVYQEETTVLTVSEERDRMIDITRHFQIQELTGRGGVLCYTFVRSSGERSKIVIVVLSPSWYLWKENLEQNVKDDFAFRSCHLSPWLKNPAGSDPIKVALKEMSKQNVRDLLLTSLRNFDKIREVDSELGQVLEVLHFNWKQPTLKIELL